MTIIRHNENDIHRQLRTLMMAGTWLLILATSLPGNALAGTAAKGPEKRSSAMTTDDRLPTSIKTATFAMG
ncbi:MAG: hypothetical protein ABIL58_16685 [Pseudomonadota bacterium]